jgi:hypothetical protein
MLAAIMLVVAGAPSMAAAMPCDPCPPDCAMMKAAMVLADQHGKAPQQQERPESPCKASIACPVAVVAPLLAETAAPVWFAPQVADRPTLIQAAAPSRPPDRTLRPPIKL